MTDWEKRSLRLELALRVCEQAWVNWDAQTVMVGKNTPIRDFVELVLGEGDLETWQSEWRTGKEWVRLP